jgi:hypothetical protein
VFCSFSQPFTAIATSSQVFNSEMEAEEYQGGHGFNTDFSMVPPKISYCRTTISWVNIEEQLSEKKE